MSSTIDEREQQTPSSTMKPSQPEKEAEHKHPEISLSESENKERPVAQQPASENSTTAAPLSSSNTSEPQMRPFERRTGARGTAAMDPQTRKEVARKGGIAVSRNKQHMAEIGRKGGQSVSKNREHMAQIGRKGGAASRGHR